jgi:hypothetical protein
MTWPSCKSFVAKNVAILPEPMIEIFKRNILQLQGNIYK